MVCSGFSEVMGSWKIMAIRLPRTARSTLLLGPQELVAPELDAAAGVAGDRVGQQLEDGQGAHRLAGAALADQGQGLALVQLEGHLADGGQLAGRGGEGDGEISHPQERARVRAHATVFRGSKASRTASPTKTSRLSITARMRKPVMPIHGA